MKINNSSVTFSSIVGIGQKIEYLSKTENKKYLKLNRGVNAVTNIDLESCVRLNYNSDSLQIYAPNLGVKDLRVSIANEYFDSDAFENITITPGGMPGLDMILQTLTFDTIIFPQFYWGSYTKMATIRGYNDSNFKFYESVETIDTQKIEKNSCVFICNPNNPTGIKEDDNIVYKKIQELNDRGVTVIFDCPYLKLFDDEPNYTSINIFKMVSKLDNVIICESFSKSLGVSGLRLGFIWSNNPEFNEELNIRMLYAYNGVSTAPQLIVNQLLTDAYCKMMVKDFRKITTEHITKNRQFLIKNGIISNNFKNNSKGMFAIIDLREDVLLSYNIGAVGLDKFVYNNKENYTNKSRICLSVNNIIFEEFFNGLFW